MWFADVGLPLAWTLLAGWLLISVLAACFSRVRRVLPRPSIVLAGCGAAVVLFAAQAGVVDRVEDLRGPGALDRSALAWTITHRSPAATAAMKAVSTLGGTAAMAAFAVLAAALLWRARRRAIAGLVLVAALGAGLLVEIFKHLYQRARPPMVDRLVTESSFSLPSGHALGSVVVLGVLAAVAVALVRRRSARIAAVVLAAAGTGVIGVSRVYLGVHWVSDVLTGWLLGGAWLAACVTVLAILACRAPAVLSPADSPEGRHDGAAVTPAHR